MAEAPKMFEDKVEGITLRYPSAFQPTPISDDAKHVGTIFRAQAGTAALIAVRHEPGLGVLKLTGQPILQTLRTNAERAFPSQYPGFTKQKLEQELTIGNEPATAIEFTYTGSDQQTVIRQRLVIVLARGSDGYYLSFQAPAAQFEAHRADFQVVLDSVRFPEPVKPKL